MAHDHEDPTVGTRTDGTHTGGYHNDADPYAIPAHLALGQMGELALPRGYEAHATSDEGVADGADPDWWGSAFTPPSRPGNSTR